MTASVADSRFQRIHDRREWAFLVAPLLAMAIVVTSYFLLGDLASRCEAALVGWVGAELSDSIVGRAGPSSVLLDGRAGRFGAEITPSCSSAVPVAVQVAVGWVLMPGGRVERLQAVGLASSMVLVANLTRLLVIVLVGADRGPGVLVVLHDWVGTMISFTAASLGLLLMVRLLATSPGSDAEQATT